VCVCATPRAEVNKYIRLPQLTHFPLPLHSTPPATLKLNMCHMPGIPKLREKTLTSNMGFDDSYVSSALWLSDLFPPGHQKSKSGLTGVLREVSSKAIPAYSVSVFVFPLFLGLFQDGGGRWTRLAHPPNTHRHKCFACPEKELSEQHAAYATAACITSLTHTLTHTHTHTHTQHLQATQR